jgi:hypothetical protein
MVRVSKETDKADDYVRLKVQRRRTLGDLKGSLSSGRAYPGKEAERGAARKYVFMKAK